MSTSKGIFLASGLALALSLTAGCGRRHTKDLQKYTPVEFSGAKLLLMTGTSTRGTGNSLVGRAKYKSEKTLPTSGANLTADLKLERGSSFTWISFADTDLKGGVEFTITRATDGNYTLKSTDPIKGEVDLTPVLKDAKVSATAESLAIEIDIHSNHGHGDLIVNGEEAAEGALKFGVLPEKVTHRSWGFELGGAGAELRSIAVGNSEHTDH